MRDGKYAEIMVNNQWTPICGHCFWDNNAGANLFCQKLDSKRYMSGKFGNVMKYGTHGIKFADPLPSEGYKIGECLIGDKDLSSCSGRTSNCDSSHCYTSTGCESGSEATVEIQCFGM